ncbi:hypothetical protein [Vibrio phage BONAISHI]|nr:hypothetical protein [Vibrio phage BONAISHI]
MNDEQRGAILERLAALPYYYEEPGQPRKVIPSPRRQLAMREIIEHYMGFVNHFGKDSPVLSLVTHRRTFDHDWERRYQIRRIIKLGLPKILNMSAMDIFTKLPNGLYMDIIEDMQKDAPQHNQMIEELEEQFEEAGKRKK